MAHLTIDNALHSVKYGNVVNSRGCRTPTSRSLEEGRGPVVRGEILGTCLVAGFAQQTYLHINCT